MADAQINVNHVRIPVSELRPDMVLARNVINESGILLLARDTVLTRQSYKRLIISRIPYVYIKEYSINYNTPQFTENAGGTTQPTPSGNVQQSVQSSDSAQQILPESHVPISSRVDFNDFQREYTRNNYELKSNLLAIGGGANADVEQLSEMTESVMRQLKNKNNVFSYLNFLKDKDEYTYAHSSNVAMLANLFGYWLGFDTPQIKRLTAAGLLHDIGKTKIPSEILNKTTRLSDSECEEVKKHTTLGYRMLERLDLHTEIKYAALMHHEKIDGTGYPLGAKGSQIKHYAKIITICDMYDALTSGRIHNERLCPFDAIKQFEQSSYGTIDTEMLLVFLKNVAYTFLGNWVRLSDERYGEVVFINSNNLSRPMIRIGSEIIDLNTDKSRNIVEII